MRKKNKKVSPAKKPFLVLSRRAITGWLVAIFFVCAWMFIIGLLVGRGTSPLRIDVSKLQQKLEAAMAELRQKKQEQTQKNSQPTKDKADLDFYETLPEDREETAVSEMRSLPPIAENVEPASENQPSKPQKFSMKRQTKKPEKEPESGGSPKSESAPKSDSAATAPKSQTVSPEKPYTIQVAAFKAAIDADNKVAQLKKKGFPAYRAIGKVPGSGIWYRVRVGAYDNKAEADKTILKLRRDGLKPVFMEK